jgi:hypothetical protein
MVAQFRDGFEDFGALRRRRNEIEYPVKVTDTVVAEEIEEALAVIAAMLERATALLPSLGLFASG